MVGSASCTRTRTPARASSMAADSPFGPLPTTTASDIVEGYSARAKVACYLPRVRVLVVAALLTCSSALAGVPPDSEIRKILGARVGREDAGAVIVVGPMDD